MNDMELYAVIFCVSTIAVAVLFTWLFGRAERCNGNCEQGRRCRCQKESKHGRT